MAPVTVLRPRVVGVDDNPAHAATMTEILKQGGFEAIFAATGTEALRLVRDTRPAAVLLDVQLPDLDGYAVCRSLKSDSATADIPVVFYTATEDAGAAKAKRLGAAAFLTYPVEPAHLFIVLRGVIGNIDRRRTQTG